MNGPQPNMRCSPSFLLICSFPLLRIPLVLGAASGRVDLSLPGALCNFCGGPEHIAKMQNDEGQNMDLYIPRKCSATNRLITSKDHASVQINIGHLDETGRYTGQFSTFALCGFVRAQGDADSGLDRLWQKKKVEVRQQ